jgi:competence protein ComEA
MEKQRLRPTIFRRIMGQVLDTSVGIVAGEPVKVLSEADVGEESKVTTQATQVKARPMVNDAKAPRRAPRPAPSQLKAPPSTLAGMSFADMLELSRRSDERERERLLDTLPPDSPFRMALRYRIEAMPETPVADADAASRRGRSLPTRQPTPQLPAPAVDLATAGVPELTRIPGIGRVKAQRIVEERSLRGPFHSLADLSARVEGIGSVVAEQISGYLLPLPAAKPARATKSVKAATDADG